MKPAILLLVLVALLAPARALPPNDAVVVFNEIHYNPPGTGEAGEWIELFNMMGVSVDLSDWRIAGGADFAFTDGTVIPAGGHLVIAKTPGGIPGSLGPFTGALGNSGDTLRLLDNNDRAMDEFTYGDKGAWPVAPDGGGATLAKRDPYRGSARAENWMASAQIAGTPGAGNFPPPPPPVTTRVIPQNSTWKYSQTAQAAGWQNPAFSDAAWSSGPAGLQFGNPQIYMDPPPAVPGGIWSVLAWTGDADSGVSSAKSYTHKIGFNRAGGYTAINGVTFDSPGSNALSGANWVLLGATNAYTNNGNGQGANNLPAGTGSRQLCEEFFYGNSLGGKSRLELSGLTPNQGYIATFYTTGFGDPPVRRNAITPSESGTAFIVDENATGSGNGLIVKYHYTASGNGTAAFDFLPIDAGTWHHYAFSNEVATAPPIEAAATAAIADFSSQRTTGFTRAVVNCVNGSGLAGQTHGVTANGTMWQSNGSPADPLPAVITFDLGGVTHLTSFHVWNYNDSAAIAAGAKSVEVLVATVAAGPFTSVGMLNFIRASGLATEPGQHFEIDRTGVRYVRFNITSNHGDANQLTGLSEVKFYVEGTPPAPTPVLFREKISSLFNTGIAPDGTLAAPGTSDPHYTNVTNGIPAVVQNGHPAWLGPDGFSQWTGLTGSGSDSTVAGQFTWRTTANLSGYVLASVDAKLYVAADNSVDNVLLNGVSKGITAGGFAGYFGPFPVTGWAAGANTIDFVWSNAGPDPNPGGFRAKWDATAQPLLAKTALPSNPVTTYFRQKFTYNGNPASAYRLLLNYIADDGAVFYLNGTELHRVRMTGSPTSTTLADSDVVYPKFSGAIEVPVTALLTGENTLAVELHQSSAGNVDAFFLATLDLIETPPAPTLTTTISLGELAGANDATWFAELRNTGAGAISLAGYTLSASGGASFALSGSLAAGAVLALDQTALGFRPLDGDKIFLNGPGIVADAQVVKNRAQARNAAGNWLTPNATTPGGANTFSIPDAIVINEIMYHHAPTYLATGITESAEEWVELYNKSASPVVLTGWKLSGGIGFDFAAGTQIPAGGFLVVAKDAAALLAKFPGITVVGPLSGSLSHSDDSIVLEDANNNAVSAVHYFDSGRWDERADGGGSSLELRNPGADHSVPEAWAASDESGKAAWQTFSYPATLGAPPTGSNDPTNYNELVLGLLNSGEFLLDDVSVTESSAGQCIQNGNFSSGSSNFWRNLGNHGSHGRTVVVDDPASPGNKVLKVVATGATEHMHNHCETTLKNGSGYVTIDSAKSYAISFRARWVSGSPRLNSRLYFNRLSRQAILPIPANTGTPGAQNSRFLANPGPTFSALSHSPVLPDANAPVTVSVKAADPQNVASVSLKWKTDGAISFNTVAMTLNGDHYEGTIPAQNASTLAQFYVEAADGAGAISTFPAAGANSRALVRWKDGIAPTTLGHGFRILMTTADANFMHEPTNAMSNDYLPCTVVYRESEVYYDAAVRLKSSQRGRPADIRLGFAVKFDPMHPFRGTHTTVNLDRSGYGRGTGGYVKDVTPGYGFGHSEIISWLFMQRAGGVPSMWNDLVYLIAPRSVHNGSSMLTMAEFNDVWCDSQFPDGAATPTFKYELIYFPLTTVGNSPEGLKLPSPDDVKGVEFGQTNSADKEAHRWNFLIGNARDRDDYSRIINLNNTYRLTGAAFNNAIPTAIDIDQWLRAAAALALAGVGDNYITSSGAWHNLKLYHRADGRILYLPWDLDFQNQPANASLIINPDISAITSASAANARLFYQHLQDIIATSFNATYLTPWVNHYQPLTTDGGNWSEIITYVNERVAFVNTQINSAYPVVTFANTSSSASGANATISGKGWIDVRTIVVQGGLELAVIWTSKDTWQVSVPISPGSNTIVLQALDFQGNPVGSSTVTVTGTGTTIPAAAGNLVISELYYNPAAPGASEISAGYTDNNDFEFIEVRNISAQTVNLAGCRFAAGIDYNFPSTTLAPGAYAVVARRTAAFTLRHSGIPALGEYYQPGANVLGNGGEEIALIGANSADIVRFSYGDNLPWPASPDGTGPSLVLIAPKTNPDPTNPLHWRASAANEGNPRTTDALALPASLTGDDDGDGISNEMEHAIGAGAFPKIGRDMLVDGPHVTFTLERSALADVRWDLENSASLAGWGPVGTAYEIIVRTNLPGGLERVTVRAVAPTSGSSLFLRAKVTAKP